MHNQSGRKSDTLENLTPPTHRSYHVQSDSPYKGGAFHFNLDLPENFPFKAPSVMRVPDSFCAPPHNFYVTSYSRLSLLPFPFCPISLTRLHRSPWFVLSAVTDAGEIHDEDLSPWDQRGRSYLRPSPPRSGMSTPRRSFLFSSAFIARRD